MWTHYYDKELLKANPNASVHCGPPIADELDGLRYNKIRYEYKTALEWGGFCGGSNPYSYWLPRKDILTGLNHFGYVTVSIGFDTPFHPNGPAFAIVARR
jgi:hypothetical protein